MLDKVVSFVKTNKDGIIRETLVILGTIGGLLAVGAIVKNNQDSNDTDQVGETMTVEEELDRR